MSNTLFEITEERRFRRFVHLKSVGIDRIPKIILVWNSEDTKKKIKFRQQWMDEVRRSMISKDRTEEGAED